MSARARRRRLERSRGSIGKKILLGLSVLLAVVGIALASVGLWVENILADTPSIDELKPIDRGQTSKVYASDGSFLGTIQASILREPVDFDKIPESLKKSTVAIEDENFYEHSGVDWGAVVRAAVENAEAGFEARQGGSTITQQLVKNLYIHDPQETLERKIREAKLSMELEDEHSKNWILDQYLNTASYGTNDGRTAVGVKAAAEVYFNKDVSDLDIKESALLAGLPQAPSQYNPFLNPHQAKIRRNEVLEKLHEQYPGFLDAAKYAKLTEEGLGLDAGNKYETIHEPYFFDYVTQELIERYGVQQVREGGLKVYTTINPALQALAVRAVQDCAVCPPGGPSAALASVDAPTGHILAMASSGTYSESQNNLAANAHRQPGSSFKPFVLATALKEGIDPESTYYNGTSPVTLHLCDYCDPWVVNNAEPGGGTMNLVDATTHSVNAVYAQLGMDVGPENFDKTAHSLGITSPLQGVPAEAIGGLGVGVSPLEMADAYASFADGGLHHDVSAISKVEFPSDDDGDPGKVDDFEEPEGKRVLTDGVAYEVTQILETVLDSGTAAGNDIPCPAAGKTGTTDEQTDAWFVGYTPRISTAVWVGYPNSRTSMGSAAFGGSYAAPIWQEYMSEAIGNYCGDWPEPQNPFSGTSFYSDKTVSPDYDSSDSTYDSTGSGTVEPDKSSDSTSSDSDTSNGNYDPDLYAPGAGQEPLPTPPENNGNSQGGGPPSTVPPTGGGAGGGGSGGVGG
jgi:penicillin-binding protein 1A